jgi:hypothetical protein
MTIPHRRPQKRPATAGESGVGEPREPRARQPGPVTYDDAARRHGPGAIGARERYDELSMRDHLARAAGELALFVAGRSVAGEVEGGSLDGHPGRACRIHGRKRGHVTGHSVTDRATAAVPPLAAAALAAGLGVLKRQWGASAQAHVMSSSPGRDGRIVFVDQATTSNGRIMSLSSCSTMWQW